jgi:hypothetical protein
MQVDNTQFPHAESDNPNEATASNPASNAENQEKKAMPANSFRGAATSSEAQREQNLIDPTSELGAIKNPG